MAHLNGEVSQVLFAPIRTDCVFRIKPGNPTYAPELPSNTTSSTASVNHMWVLTMRRAMLIFGECSVQRRTRHRHVEVCPQRIMGKTYAKGMWRFVYVYPVGTNPGSLRRKPPGCEIMTTQVWNMARHRVLAQGGGP